MVFSVAAYKIRISALPKAVWIACFLLAFTPSYAQSDFDSKGSITPIELKPGEEVEKDWVLKAPGPDGSEQIIEIKARVKTEADEKRFQKSFGQELKNARINHPDTKIMIKVVIEDPHGKNFEFSPNQFFEFHPENLQHRSRLNKLLSHLGSSSKDLTLASVRFSATSVGTTTALVLSGTSLMTSGLIGLSLGTVSGLFTAFPVAYKKIFFKQRFESNKILGKTIGGLMTLEQLATYTLMEAAFSTIGPMILALSGQVSQLSIGAYMFITGSMALFVSLSQGMFERALDDNRRNKTLDSVANFNSIDQSFLEYMLYRLKTNKAMVIGSATSVIAMVGVSLGGYLQIPELQYVGAAALMSLAVAGLSLQWWKNKPSDSKLRILKANLEKDLRHSNKLMASSIESIGNKVHRKTHQGTRRFLQIIRLAGADELDRLSEDHRLRDSAKQFSKSLKLRTRALSTYVGARVSGNATKKNRAAEVFESILRIMQKNAYEAVEQNSCRRVF